MSIIHGPSCLSVLHILISVLLAISSNAVLMLFCTCGGVWGVCRLSFSSASFILCMYFI